MSMKTPREVREDASMKIMQGWFGEIDLNYKPQTHFLNFRKELIDGALNLHVQFELVETDGNEIKVSMPVDNFQYMQYTDKNFAYEQPVALIFTLDITAYKELERSVPGLYASWKLYYAEKGKPFTDCLMFVLDPSEINFFEDDNILYRPGYVEGVDMLRETFKESWSDHLRENAERDEPDLEGNILFISSSDFIQHYEKIGLRNVESTVATDNKKKPVRIFYLHVKKETRASKRAAKKRGALAMAAEAERLKKAGVPDIIPVIDLKRTREPSYDVEQEEIKLIEREMKRQNGENTDSDVSVEIDETFPDDEELFAPRKTDKSNDNNSKKEESEASTSADAAEPEPTPETSSETDGDKKKEPTKKSPAKGRRSRR